MKKLYKDTKNGLLYGVCAGISDMLKIDVCIVRIFVSFLIIFKGIGILPYIVLALILPDKDTIDKD